MSIDLFCYTSMAAGDLDESLAVFRKENSELLLSKFLMSEVKKVSQVGKEIAAEHELEARSSVLISLNDKAAAGVDPNLGTKLQRHGWI